MVTIAKEDEYWPEDSTDGKWRPIYRHFEVDRHGKPIKWRKSGAYDPKSPTYE